MLASSRQTRKALIRLRMHACAVWSRPFSSPMRYEAFFFCMRGSYHNQQMEVINQSIYTDAIDNVWQLSVAGQWGFNLSIDHTIRNHKIHKSTLAHASMKSCPSDFTYNISTCKNLFSEETESDATAHVHMLIWIFAILMFLEVLFFGISPKKDN